MLIGPGITLGAGITIDATAVPIPPIPEPVLYLDATDYSGSGTTWTADTGSDATLFNSPTYTAEPPTYFGFARASAQYSTVPDLGDLNTWTVEAWFRLTTALNTGATDITAVVCNEFDSNNLNFSIGTNRQPSSANICVGFYNGVWRTTTGFIAAADTWYNVTGTYDGTTVRQYLDGTEQSILNYSGTPQSGGEVRIARRWDSDTSTGNFFPGDVSIVRIWDTVLTATEVRQNFDLNRARYGV